MQPRWRRSWAILALLLAIPASMGISHLVADGAGTESTEVVASKQSAVSTQPSGTARAVLSATRTLAARPLARIAGAALALGGAFAVAAAGRRRPRVERLVRSAHLVRAASSSSRRGPPLVA
jgi:hypothetical protein